MTFGLPYTRWWTSCVGPKTAWSLPARSHRAQVVTHSRPVSGTQQIGVARRICAYRGYGSASSSVMGTSTMMSVAILVIRGILRPGDGHGDQDQRAAASLRRALRAGADRSR